MYYLLDTNIISHLIKSNYTVWHNLRQVSPDEVGISMVTYAEVCFGLAKNPYATKQRAVFHELLTFIPIQPFHQKVAEHYGQFKADLQQSGKSLTALDLMIAAHAHYLDAVLVSNDQAFFQIDGLQVQDWTK